MPTFAQITKLVIDNLEGGYYNPDWHLKQRSVMGENEVMFGINRKTGKPNTLAGLTAWNAFWTYIDSVKDQSTWTYNYLGGSHRDKITELAINVMQPRYESNCKNYMTPRLRNYVAISPRLQLNFSYATWNGPGWFQKWAQMVDKRLDDGLTDKQLFEYCMEIRLSTATSQWLTMRTRGVEKLRKIVTLHPLLFASTATSSNTSTSEADDDNAGGG